MVDPSFGEWHNRNSAAASARPLERSPLEGGIDDKAGASSVWFVQQFR
jgi:hypothetical protein